MEREDDRGPLLGLLYLILVTGACLIDPEESTFRSTGPTTSESTTELNPDHEGEINLD